MKNLALLQEQNCITTSSSFLPLFFCFWLVFLLLATELILQWLLKVSSSPICTQKVHPLLACWKIPGSWFFVSQVHQNHVKYPIERYFSIILYSSMYISTSTIPTAISDGNIKKHSKEVIQWKHLKYEASLLNIYWLF